jgi:hypothetical protein
MKQTLQSIVGKFHAVRVGWAQVPETARNRADMWYAGMAISPAEFSRQMGNLQISLQSANEAGRRSRTQARQPAVQ